MPEPLPAGLQRSLTATAAVSITELYNEGKSAANDPEEWPLVVISEVLDGNTCKLCAAVDGKILRVGTPEYREWRQPSHIGCRRILTYIHRDEQGAEADFERPDPELIRKHGHFHVQPKQHAKYRIPAEPAGRHVVVRRVRHEASGEIRTRLDWAPWWDQVPQREKQLVLRARVTADPEKLKALLARLGITDPAQPDQFQRVVRLGLRDRLEGWVTLSPDDPDEEPPTPAAPTAYGHLSAPLQGLSDESLRFWGDVDVRLQALDAIRSALRRRNPTALAQAIDVVDRAVVEGIEALGFPRGLVRSVTVEPISGANGDKSGTCALRIARAWLERGLNEGRPDGVLRTWVHESMHGRQPFAPGFYRGEYKPWSGYEEGMVEGLARWITKEQAGMDPIIGSYGYFVRSYEILAELLEADRVALYRAAWNLQTGTVRAQFADIVETFYQAQTGQPLGTARRQRLRQAADQLFRSGRSGWPEDDDAIRQTWETALQ